MHSAAKRSGTKGQASISAAAPRFGSTKLAATMIRGALTLAVLPALLLLAARPAQAQSETVLYNFTGGSDGSHPMSGLTSDGAGNFYGTTNAGGLGYGTVFELSPNGSGGWNETAIHNFELADGAIPDGSVIFDSVGNLYGTAAWGGANAYGVVFKLSPAGASWTEIVLYSFAGGPDGAIPESGLIMDPAGNLYGTTWNGGAKNEGTVFELHPSAGGWTEQVIYASADHIYNGLAMNAAGNIFGVSASTVFELSPNGSGGWTPATIYNFAGAPDGGFAQGAPVLDQAGNLYGTTLQGGANGYGIVYKLTLGSKGTWTEKILYSFKGGTKDGSGPTAGIVFDAAGNIYGTTGYAGTSSDGTVFELVAPVGTGSYKEKILWSFNGANGYDPLTSLILDSAGILYGTTSWGGPAYALGGANGYGVVFEVNPSAAATTTALTSSLNPSKYSQAVTFTAVVSSSAGVPPDGETVMFANGATVLGTAALSSGSANFTVSVLPAGTAAVTAAYGGDLNFAASTSNTVKQVVNTAATTTTLTSSPNPSTYGQAVTFTATVASSAGAPPDGETVMFKNGATVLGTAALSRGSASLTTSALPVGTTAITAVYGGDLNFVGSKSKAVKQVVKKKAG
jgi:uncharacterized repeat protein (TIGR03803 family)